MTLVDCVYSSVEKKKKGLQLHGSVCWGCTQGPPYGAGGRALLTHVILQQSREHYSPAQPGAILLLLLVS